MRPIAGGRGQMLEASARPLRLRLMPQLWPGGWGRSHCYKARQRRVLYVGCFEPVRIAYSQHKPLLTDLATVYCILNWPAVVVTLASSHYVYHRWLARLTRPGWLIHPHATTLRPFFRDNWKKNLLSSNISSTCPYMVKLRPTSDWDRFVSLGHPCYVQRYSRLASVTARHSSSGR